MVLDMKGKLSLLALALLASTALAQRAPTVTYTAIGSAGSWDLTFTLTSNFLPGEGDFYFFGVYLPTGRNITSAPANWDPNLWRDWNNISFGGSGQNYNNNWINLYSRQDDVRSALSRSSFTARSTAQVAPTELMFFAYAAGGVYNGNDNFDNYWNPGFEGMAHLTSVPEPSAIAALGLGMIGLVRRRKRN